ncbi:hypothetical protein L2E82_32432 [Cichorium intybus]|uniref:Uncharacterized protein n=1 Tax=Cichorium intybus TaxID=13427 RepID=A0ACB9BHZ2_CICIN|nr:hypothetical protein L2E82_32432 [Cichorium intybus]
MHLWPSATLRASFKLEYLNNLEWNLRRMKSEKNRKNQSSGSSNEEKLLSDDIDSQNRNSKDRSGACGAVLRDLLMIFSCCYCCYCCGVCID